MAQSQFANLFLDQSRDPIWIVNLDFQLVYANKAYLGFIKETTGIKIKLNESVLSKNFDADYIEKWTAYYKKALKKGFLEIEEQFCNSESDEIQYRQITFEPLTGDDGVIFAIGCKSKDISPIVNRKSNANQLSKMGSWELDFVNKKLFWSKEVHQLHETDPELFEPNLETAINFYEADFRPILMSLIEKCAKTGEPLDFEAKLTTAKTKERWVQVLGNPEIVDGRCLRIYGNFQDIHERKMAEIAVRESEIKFRTVFEIATLGIAQVDPSNGQVILVNSYYETITGYQTEELLKMKFSELTHPDDRAKDWELFSKAAKEKVEYRNEKRYVKKDGSIVWVRLHVAFIRDEKGKPIKTVAICEDITERKKSEEKLIDSEQKHRQLALQLQKQHMHFTNAQKVGKIGSWETDLSDLKLTWSDETYRIFGTDRENFETTHENFLKYVHPLDRDRVDKAFMESLQAPINTQNEIEHRIITPSGEVKHIEERWKITHDEENKQLLVIGICQDITERKKTEEAIRDSEEKRRLIMSGALDAIICIDTNENITFWNPQAEVIFGRNESEVLGQALSELIIPEPFREHHKKGIKHYLKTGEGKALNVLLELTAIKKSGEEFPIELTVIPIKQGKEIFFCAFIRDITQRKKVAQEKNNLQLTLENSLNEIYIFDAETYQFIYLNKGAILNIGYSEEEIKTLTPVDIKPDFTVTSFKQLVTPLLNNEKEKIIFFTNHKRKDGSLYPVEVHLQLVTEGNNKRFLAIILDITERKKAEEENSFKANLLNMIAQAAIATNLDGDVNYWNKAAENIYGWKQEEAIGKNIVHLTPNESNNTEAVQIMEMLKKGQAWSGQFNVRKKDGTYFPAYVTNSPIYDENNLLTGIIGISSDMTQEVKNKELLKQYTLELERSNEELEQFAFVASHDLQEPLRMISSFMDLLQRKYGNILDEKAHQYIYFATDGAKKMKQIILDLLDYSRAGKYTEKEETVDMNELLSEFKHLRRKLILEKNATITSNGLPSLKTYKAVITQIFHCLLDNALKYTKEGTPSIIDIDVVENEREYTFSIKDNGIGIEPQFFSKIFVIFQRLHNKDDYPGSGIGLSIAKRHVEFLGGNIWLESTPKEGTVFYFTILKTI